jgi:UDP-galactopyranose mutase
MVRSDCLSRTVVFDGPIDHYLDDRCGNMKYDGIIIDRVKPK